MSHSQQVALATFAGGCFWCMVAPFQDLPGVVRVVSGYTGGQTEYPTYEDVCSGATGHYEAVQVTFDPAVLPYEKLLDVPVLKSGVQARTPTWATSLTTGLVRQGCGIV